jgi:hypothetical protein
MKHKAFLSVSGGRNSRIWNNFCFNLHLPYLERAMVQNLATHPFNLVTQGGLVAKLGG